MARAISIWLLACCSVFVTIDYLVTQPMPIYVEDYRTPTMTDEQVFMQALQRAYEVEPLVWWVNSPKPYLVFDANRHYDIDPRLYKAFSIELTTDSEKNRVGLFKPTLATAHDAPLESPPPHPYQSSSSTRGSRF